MNILQEMKLLGFDIKSTTPRIHCRVFEDNAGALEMAKVHKQRPRTKHMHVKLHHFRSYVNSGAISIHKVPTLDNHNVGQPVRLLNQIGTIAVVQEASQGNPRLGRWRREGV